MLIALAAPVESTLASGLPPGTLLLDAAQAGQALIVVGERGAIARSTDHAVSWQPVSSGVRAPLTAVSFANASRGWAVGHDGLILTSVDGGATWSKQWQSEQPSDSFLDVLALDANRVIAVGAYGLCAATSNGGRTWERRKVIADDYHLNRLSRGPAGTLYLAGEHGVLLRSVDEGATWSPIATDYDGSFYGVLPLNEQTLLAYGLRGRLFRSEDDGGTWTQLDLGETALFATGTALVNGPILLAGNARALWLSYDGGRSFIRRDSKLGALAEIISLGDSALGVGEKGIQRWKEPPP